MTVVLDYANLLDGRVGGGGVPSADLDGRLAQRFSEALATLTRWRADGRLGFLDLPDDPGIVGQVEDTVDAWASGVDDVLILGIGGSALGAVVLREALGGVRWNASDTARGGRPRLHVVDNPDPDTLGALLGDLDPTRTAVNVISKSGSTAETMAAWLVVQDWLPADATDRILFTTDPEHGTLRPLAQRDGIAALPVPPNVGGRFSVLSAVGLVPAAVLGADLRGLLAGAAEMRDLCLSDNLPSNPAGLLATLLHAADTEMGRPIHVLMPYADRLRPLALWFQQLWAESLGKDGRGPTPLPALGAVDQHAQVQLFMEGPHDKVVLFVSAPPEVDLTIPSSEDTPAAISYLGGHTLGGLLDAERRATTEALRTAGRPSATLELAAVDARSLGAILMLLEVATVLGGGLWGVDPMDQPGVEQGKVYTYGLMGREGFEAPAIPEADPDRRVPKIG